MTVKKQRPKASEGEFELRAHFQGRRAGRRSRVEHAVVIEGQGGSMSARPVNVSRTGALLYLGGDDLTVDGGTFLRFSRIIQDRFARGSTVLFDEGAIRRTLQIVRVTFGGLGGTFAPLLACRFDRPLKASECTRLGVSRKTEPFPSRG
jgi:hypothetical protein